MTHPLISDLSSLTDDQLQTKIGELSKRMNQAYRLGMGDALMQLRMILEDYQAEQTRRNQKSLAELMEKSAEFKGIIDIQ